MQNYIYINIYMLGFSSSLSKKALQKSTMKDAATPPWKRAQNLSLY